ncbi:type II toxin-antitoxin system RelE/ParE family toxin [Methylorubrum aminovorans]|uniref:type II toxin-antitoxin system RelE/ParE family toxin n=1 Tax=Methylorubrum aminovorans TaxID=269069 RepID=UPI001EDE51DE|nr:type II toxin-antitoxin system RelE/ParE family toxin [Methylorubrum aminovorans]
MPLPRRLILSREAALDIEAARRWLRQPGAGRRAAERLRQIRVVILELRTAPLRWPFGEHDGVREAGAGSYRILYQVEPESDISEGDVVVLRVFGPRQDRSDLLRGS